MGIAISAALGMINDSYVVTLNGSPAKLFRSGTLTIRDILLMNGCRYGDMMGHTGANLTYTLNGNRQFIRGGQCQPAKIVLLQSQNIGVTQRLLAPQSHFQPLCGFKIHQQFLHYKLGYLVAGHSGHGVTHHAAIAAAAQYRLDGYPMSTLQGHFGRRLEVDLVATFLPREVVDSLYTVVGRLGLEVSSLIARLPCSSFSIAST